MNRRFSSIFAVCFPLTSCGGGSSQPPSSTSGTDSAADSGQGDCVVGFGAPREWALPSGSGDWRHPQDRTCSGDDDELHLLKDMDGDERPDLVRIYDCGRSSGLGDEHWRVHLSTGSGFAAEPIDWSLPASSEPYAWSAQQDGVCERDPDHLFDLVDMDGDLRPDLVVLNDCDDSTSHGRDHWQVHLNTGTGFSPDALTWPAPAELAPDGWHITSQVECSHLASEVFELVDLDGDEAPELLATARCEPDIAESHPDGTWRVWRNTGEGFADEEESWAMPTDHGGDLWPATSGSQCAQDPDHIYSLVDIDGDEIPDLVITWGCDDDRAWDQAWRVYFGSGDGFGPAQSWPIPVEAPPGVWSRPFSDSCQDGGELASTLMDLDGDELLDLVWLGECRGETVPAAWGVLSNTGQGFSEEPVAWRLPEDGEPLTWTAMSDQLCNDTDDSLLSIFDLDGDELPDVVETYGCQPDGAVGSSHWRVHPGGCHR